MARTIHHTQIKAAAKAGFALTVDGTDMIVATTPDRPDVVIAAGTDAKALLAQIAGLDHAFVLNKIESFDHAQRPQVPAKTSTTKTLRAAKAPAAAKTPRAPKAPKVQLVLTSALNDRFVEALRRFTADGKNIDIHAVNNVAVANAVDMSKYDTTSPGWQGRYRMTLGNILRGMLRRGLTVKIGRDTFSAAK